MHAEYILKTSTQTCERRLPTEHSNFNGIKIAEKLDKAFNNWRIQKNPYQIRFQHSLLA